MIHPLEWREVEPGWAEFALSDGTKLRLRVVLTECLRRDEWDPRTGQPLYDLKAQLVSRVEAQSALVRPPSEAPGVAARITLVPPKAD